MMLCPGQECNANGACVSDNPPSSVAEPPIAFLGAIVLLSSFAMYAVRRD